MSKKLCGYVLLLAEEVLGLQTDFSDITLNLAYSEKDGTLELVCASAGAPANPMEEGAQEDDIGIKLIQSRCESYDYQYENGKNILTFNVQEKLNSEGK